MPCQIIGTLKTDSTSSNPVGPRSPALGCRPHPPNTPPPHAPSRPAPAGNPRRTRARGSVLRQFLQPGLRPAPRATGELRPCLASPAPEAHLSPEPGDPSLQRDAKVQACGSSCVCAEHGSWEPVAPACAHHTLKSSWLLEVTAPLWPAERMPEAVPRAWGQAGAMQAGPANWFQRQLCQCSIYFKIKLKKTNCITR